MQKSITTVLPVCSLKVKTRSFVEWLANTWLFCLLLNFIGRLIGIPIKQVQFPTFITAVSSNYLAVVIDKLLHVYYNSKESNRYILIGQITIEPNESVLSICTSKDEKYLACLTILPTNQLTIRLFDLENWVELVKEFTPASSSIDFAFGSKLLFYFLTNINCTFNEYSVVLKIGDFVNLFGFKSNDKQLELSYEWKFQCQNCCFAYENMIISEGEDGRLKCCRFANEQITEIGSHLINSTGELHFSHSTNDSQLLYVSDGNALWIFDKTTFSLLSKSLFKFDNLNNFYVIDNDNEQLQIIHLSSNGKLLLSNRDHCFSTELLASNCLLLSQQKQKQFIYGTMESFGLFSIDQYLIISQLVVKDEIDTKIEAILEGLPVQIDGEFLEKYLNCDPLDSQGIITTSLLDACTNVIEMETKKILKDFVPKSWADAKEIFRLVGKKQELILLDFFVSYCQSDADKFQDEFILFQRLDPDSLCKLFAVNCCFDLIELYWEKVQNPSQVLDCIPEFTNPSLYLHFLQEENLTAPYWKEWIENRAILVYSCTGNLDYTCSLLELIPDKKLEKKFAFFNKLLHQFNLLEYEKVSQFLSLNPTECGFFIFGFGKERPTNIFSSFIIPFYESFYSQNDFDLFLIKFITKEPKVTLKLIEKGVLKSESVLLSIFWHFPHSDVGLVERFVDFYSSPPCSLNNNIKNVLEITKIFLKYKITFSNGTEITNISKNSQLIFDSFDRLFARLKFITVPSGGEDSEETFWFELLNDSLELWSLFEIKIDKLKLFERYIRCILLSQTRNSVVLAKAVLKDCIDLNVLGRDCANEIIYSVAKESFLEIESFISPPSAVQTKLEFTKKCLSLSFPPASTSEISHLTHLIEAEVPKLKRYLQNIDVDNCDLNAHHLLNYSIDWILLHKIIPFHPTSYKDPLAILNEFGVSDLRYKQKIFSLALKMEFNRTAVVRFDLLEQISDPFIWKFIYSLLLNDPTNDQLMKAFVNSHPPVDLLNRIVGSRLNLASHESDKNLLTNPVSLPNKIRLKFDTRISFLYPVSPIHSNLVTFPKLCLLLPKSKFTESNAVEFYYYCHPDLPDSQLFFKQTIEKQKEELLENLNQMSTKELYENYLNDSSFESTLPTDRRKPIYQSMFVLLMTDPSLPLPSIDRITQFTKYFDNDFLITNILILDLLLDRAELLYYSILNFKSELRTILTSRIELIYSVQELKHSYRISDLFYQSEQFLTELFIGPFQQDVDFLVDFCTKIPPIDNEFLDLWSTTTTTTSVSPSFSQVEFLICKIFLSLSNPLPSRIEQLQNSISLPTYRNVIGDEKTRQSLFLSPSLLQLVCIYLELNDEFDKYELLVDNYVCLYWMYLRRRLIKQRSGNESGSGSESELGDFEWKESSNESSELSDFEWGADQQSQHSNKTEQIQNLSTSNNSLAELIEIERGMTKWTFNSPSQLQQQHRTQLEYFVFFIYNYQLDYDFEIVQIIYQQLIGFSKGAMRHRNWFTLFLISYLQTRFDGNGKKEIELMLKCCSLLNTFSTRDLMFKQPIVLIKQTIQGIWKQLTNTPIANSPFSESTCYLNEGDLIESVYCLLIEQLFENDYQSVILEMIQQAMK